MFSSLCIYFTFIVGMLNLVGVTDISWLIVLAPTLIVSVGRFILYMIIFLAALLIALFKS